MFSSSCFMAHDSRANIGSKCSTPLTRLISDIQLRPLDKAGRCLDIAQFIFSRARCSSTGSRTLNQDQTLSTTTTTTALPEPVRSWRPRKRNSFPRRQTGGSRFQSVQLLMSPVDSPSSASEPIGIGGFKWARGSSRNTFLVRYFIYR